MSTDTNNKVNSNETTQKFTFYGLQNLLQTVISLAVVIYTVGFLVVNANYSIYGITDYQLVETRYIAAGSNFLFTHLGIAAMVAIVVFLLDKNTKVVWFIIPVILWGVLAIPICLANQSVFATVVVGFNALIISFTGYLIWAIWKGKLFKQARAFSVSISLPEESFTAFLGFSLVLLLGVGTICWGWSFWPVTSSVFGGGRPNEVVLTFDADKLPQQGLPFIPMQNSFVSEQLPVLFERPNEFVLLIEMASTDPNAIKISGLTAVRISKSLVHSAIFARSTPFKSGQRQPIPTVSFTSSPISTPVQQATPPP